MKLLISPRCFLCRFAEPWLRWWAWRHGERLRIYKLGRDGVARQVNGQDEFPAGWVPAVPALLVGPLCLVGLGAIRRLVAPRR